MYFFNTCSFLVNNQVSPKSCFICSITNWIHYTYVTLQSGQWGGEGGAQKGWTYTLHDWCTTQTPNLMFYVFKLQPGPEVVRYDGFYRTSQKGSYFLPCWRLPNIVFVQSVSDVVGIKAVVLVVADRVSNVVLSFVLWLEVSLGKSRKQAIPIKLSGSQHRHDITCIKGNKYL